MSQLNALQALCRQLLDGEICEDTFLERCTRMVAEAIECSRVGVWMFTHDVGGKRLTCLKMFDRTRDRVVHVPEEQEQKVAPYFEALQEEGHIVAPDAHAHPATAGLFVQNLESTGVKSLMAAAFSVNGILYGALTCTQLNEPKQWTSRQLQSLKRMGARASLALHQAREASLSRSLLAV
jgi:GAF domain-containing protein